MARLPSSWTPIRRNEAERTWREGRRGGQVSCGKADEVGRPLHVFLSAHVPFSTAPCSVPLALLFRSRLLPTAHKDCPIQEFNWNLINPITASHHPILSHRISNVERVDGRVDQLFKAESFRRLSPVISSEPSMATFPPLLTNSQEELRARVDQHLDGLLSGILYTAFLV